jgi:hypothetical protein
MGLLPPQAGLYPLPHTSFRLTLRHCRAELAHEGLQAEPEDAGAVRCEGVVTRPEAYLRRSFGVWLADLEPHLDSTRRPKVLDPQSFFFSP